jgi:hypothetical protein
VTALQKVETGLRAPVTVREITAGSSLRDFLDVVDDIYRDDPKYVRPLNLELSERLNPKKNPFFLHAEGTRFVAYRDGRPVGRITAQVDRAHLEKFNDGTGFFGFFDTIDDPAVASALLTAAETWLSSRGITRVRGPFSLGINEETGCLVEGFDTPPSVMMPHHRPYQASLIERAGYTKAKDFYAWNYGIGEPHPRMTKARELLRELKEVSVRPLDMKNFATELRTCLDIFNDAWSDNWGALPLTEAEAEKMQADMKMLLVPNLTRVAFIDGEAAGFAIGIPNLNEQIADLGGSLFPFGWLKLLYRLKFRPAKTGRLALLGIRKKYRNVRRYAPLALELIGGMNDGAREFGLESAELSWTLEDNAAVNAAIRAVGGKRYKVYRVFERALDGP